MKILISAYACEPNRGSEPGVGWASVSTLAKLGHDIDVLTRRNNEHAIKAQCAKEPLPNVQFHYYDLPVYISWFKKGRRGIHLYYYLWQIGIYYFVKRTLHEKSFDFVHHVTLARYWTPSFLSFLPIPFIWGPVGGGEPAPYSLWKNFGVKGCLLELLREVIRFISEFDPLLRHTARQSLIAFGTTDKTTESLKKLGASNAHQMSQVALTAEEFENLSSNSTEEKATTRFITVSELTHRKALHLAIRAFAKCNVKDKSYWIIGEGPEATNLHALSVKLGVSDQIEFLGRIPRNEVIDKLQQCGTFLFPSLRDSGGIAVAEAMAAGLPVICCDIGGPAVQVTEETGIKITPTSHDQLVEDFASHMTTLANQPERCQLLGNTGRQRIAQKFNWEDKMTEVYQLALKATKENNS